MRETARHVWMDCRANQARCGARECFSALAKRCFVEVARTPVTGEEARGQGLSSLTARVGRRPPARDVGSERPPGQPAARLAPLARYRLMSVTPPAFRKKGLYSRR